MVIEILDTSDFFQEQIKQCKTSARPTNKNDRDFRGWPVVGKGCCKPDSLALLLGKLRKSSASGAWDLQSDGALLSAVISATRQQLLGFVWPTIIL